jgi:hypothetical protein
VHAKIILSNLDFMGQTKFSKEDKYKKKLYLPFDVCRYSPCG